VRMLKRHQDQSDGNYVYRSERGGPLSPQIVQVIVARAGAEAGLSFKVHPVARRNSHPKATRGDHAAVFWPAALDQTGEGPLGRGHAITLLADGHR
jgi:hypothetical protein